MKPRVLADTTPLYAAVDSSDEYHANSQAELEWLIADGIDVVIPTFVLTEAYTLIQRRLGTPAALQWLSEIDETTARIDATPLDVETAIAALHLFPDQSLTLVDVLLYVVSERLSVPIWTYDFHFDILRANRWYPE